LRGARKLSPELKAWRLANIADSLEKAMGWNGLSHAGMSMIRHAHEPPGWVRLRGGARMRSERYYIDSNILYFIAADRRQPKSN